MIFNTKIAIICFLFLFNAPHPSSPKVINLKANSPNIKKVDNCDFILELVVVQDVSNSYSKYAEALKAGLHKLVDIVTKAYPGSRFALSCFTDKPRRPNGYDETTWRDFCISVRSTLSQPISTFLNAVDELQFGGGFDFREAQLEAMVRALVFPGVEWSSTPNDSATGKPIVRVLLMATDSIFHGHGNFTSVVYPDSDIQPLPTGILKNVDSPTNAGCATYDYPGSLYLGFRFKQRKTLPIFLLSPAEYECGKKQMCKYPELTKWANIDPIFNDPMEGMVRVYSDLINDMGVTGIVQPLGNNFEGFEDILGEALKELTGLVCPITATTTPTPSTTTATTTSTSISTTTTASTTTTTLTTTNITATTTTPTTAIQSTKSTTTSCSSKPPCSCDGCTTNCCVKCGGQIAVKVDISINDGRPSSNSTTKTVLQKDVTLPKIIPYPKQGHFLQ